MFSFPSASLGIYKQAFEPFHTPRHFLLLSDPPRFRPTVIVCHHHPLLSSSSSMANRFLFRYPRCPRTLGTPSSHRSLRLGLLCSPQVDESIQDFEFHKMRDSIVAMSTNSRIIHSVIAVIGDPRREPKKLSDVW